jgi:hypothetical protein
VIRRLGLALLALAAAAAPARAEPDLFSGETLSALADLRLALADGETAWTRRGYGKTRYGGDDGRMRAHAELAEAAVSWKPRLDWTWSGVFTAQFQPGQEHEVDLVEAYVAYKPVPSSPVRFSGRAGLFWPHISQEHGDPFWGTSYSITPSAINSWVGEEIKVMGAEGTVSAPVAGSTLTATAGLFGYNDTSGTLLALRGWALDDLKSAAFSTFPLPRLDEPFARIWRGQDPFTEPTRHDIDDRLGFYGRLEWRTPYPVSFDLFYYDNGGNPTKVSSQQWAWDTRFWNLGAAYDLDADTRILSQVMWGETIEGMPTPQGVWIDVGYTSAYLLGTHSFGRDRLSARVEYFRTRDRTWQARDNNNERGWAATGAWRRDLTANVSLLAEVMHVSSDRPARAYQSVAREQTSTVVQSSLRVKF